MAQPLGFAHLVLVPCPADAEPFRRSRRSGRARRRRRGWPARQKSPAAAGWQLGPGCYVKYARIAVADEIGVLTKARATVILVGERPGLGTGDSLSVYIAVAPKLGQDNA